jgi:cobalt-zinc-cadmium efflux system outer membrane protein
LVLGEAYFVGGRCSKLSIWKSLLAVAIWVTAVGAQEGATEVLTLEKALELSEQYNPQIRAAAAGTDLARAGIRTARMYPNPESQFLFGQQYGRLSFNPPGPAGLLQHYSIGQLIELPSVRQTRIETAQLGESSAELVALEIRRTVRGAVKQAFYEVLRRQSEVRLSEENLRLIEDLRRRVQVQVEVGEAARLELTRAEAEVATAQTLARGAQLRYLTAVSSLRTAINSPLGSNIDARGTLDPAVLLPGLAKLREDVMLRHPAIAAADTEVRRAEARLRSERAQRKPQPTFRVEYENQPDLGFYRMGVSIPVPLWNKREGPIAEAEAALRQTQAFADIRRLEITGALERAYRLYEAASQQVSGLEKGALQEAEAALRAAEAAFRFGERGIIEVLDAQRVLRSVRTEYLNAQYDRQAAWIELQQLQALDISLPGGKP